MSGLQMGVILAVALTIGAFRVDLTIDPPDQIMQTDQELVQMEEIQQTVQIEKPPPPPRPPVPVAVPDDMVLDDSDLDLDAFLDVEASVDLPPPPPVPAMEEEPDEEIFVVVEQQPTIIGGLEKLYEVTPYPEIARRSEMEGTVVVKIVVNEDGMPSDPVVVRGVHEVLDNAAVRGVMSLRFEPGRQRSRAVKTYMAIPVRFRLN
ncbi:MAG: energy transducer TonB [Rhodothermales bacterium]|nr:energy transducer TonB [Rhodothermales bacterium]